MLPLTQNIQTRTIVFSSPYQSVLLLLFHLPPAEDILRSPLFMFANEKCEGNLINFLSCSENIRLLQAPKLMYGSGGVRINPVTVLVGAVLPGMGSVKAFVGCLAALQIGTFLTNLTTPAAQNPKRFVLGCDPGCSGNVCQNGGRCLERWNRKYRCYCWGNPFVGRACDKSELDWWTNWRLKGFVIWSSGVYLSEIYQLSIVFMALCVIIWYECHIFISVFSP